MKADFTFDAEPQTVPSEKINAMAPDDPGAQGQKFQSRRKCKPDL